MIQVTEVIKKKSSLFHRIVLLWYTKLGIRTKKKRHKIRAIVVLSSIQLEFINKYHDLTLGQFKN